MLPNIMTIVKEMKKREKTIHLFYILQYLLFMMEAKEGEKKDLKIF